MKTLLLLTLSFSVVLFGCKEKIVEYHYSDDKVFHNDLLHGDIVGRVLQKQSGALVYVSQEKPVDSTTINIVDGSFSFRDLRAGNYDLKIVADNYRIYSRSNVIIPGGSIAFVGEIDLSTVPDLVASIYPENRSEVVTDWRYGRITISVLFTRPMDRMSVEKAFSTDPPSDGIFYWGNYTQAPMTRLYADAGNARFEPGATITTFSKVTSVTYQMSRKDFYVDTNYTVTISTDAKDTSGNHLRFPLASTFRTVQSYFTVYGIQTNPVHGDIDIEPSGSYGGITLTFPRRMDPASTEAALRLNPPLNRAVLWPDGNVMNIWTGGPFPSDTTIAVEIDGSALDRDGISLGETFSFWFRTAAFRVRYTSPANAQLYVPRSGAITISFNNYVNKSSVQTAFSISPAIAGTIDYTRDYYGVEILDQIVFSPSSSLLPNTKYTVSISTAARDINGVDMKIPHSFSFVTRQ